MNLLLISWIVGQPEVGKSGPARHHLELAADC